MLEALSRMGGGWGGVCVCVFVLIRLLEIEV